MRICTIGFTHKTAEDFFTRLGKAGVKRVVDVRLNNVSQLAGFAKKDDLAYFLKELCGIDYVHLPELAPQLPVRPFQQYQIAHEPTSAFSLAARTCSPAVCYSLASSQRSKSKR